MLSIHGVNDIKVKSSGTNWIELTFKSKFDGDTTICLYISSAGSAEEWESTFVAALHEAISNLPPAPVQLKLVNADE